MWVPQIKVRSLNGHWCQENGDQITSWWWSFCGFTCGYHDLFEAKTKWLRFCRRYLQKDFLKDNSCISIKIALKSVRKGSVDGKRSLVQVMAWCRIGNKPLPEPMVTQFIEAYVHHQVSVGQLWSFSKYLHLNKVNVALVINIHFVSIYSSCCDNASTLVTPLSSDMDIMIWYGLPN